MRNKVIGIDASRAFIDKKTGTENYSYQLIKALASSDCQFRFRLYVRPGQEDVIPAAEPESILGVDPRSAFGMTTKVIDREKVWTQVGLAKETWSNPPDLLFIPAHVIPFLKNPAVPAVVTVHDLRTEFLPQHEGLIQKIYLNKYTERLRAKLAMQIIAVSESTKRDVVNRLGVNPEKVSVVYEGIDKQRFHAGIKNQESRIRKIKTKHQIGGKYILFVGTIQPRKNLVRLVEAFSRLARADSSTSDVKPETSDVSLGAKETTLVIAGGKGWNSDKIYAAPQKFGVEDKVKFIGYVEDKDLPYLYAGAEIFAFPSLYEGFGLPVLEAMAVGTPVLTSKVSSLPEVGGEAAYYVSPESVSSIVDGLSRLMTQSKLRQDLTHRGYDQVKRFSWANAAERTCEVFEGVLDES